ncbi:MAG: hypothetical protein ACOVO1_07180 [Chitinophagaceae bacterium]
MKKLQLLIALIFPVIAFAQYQQNTDSSEYYEKEVKKLIIQAIKDLKQSTKYQEAQSSLVKHNKMHNNYLAFSIYGSYHKNDIVDFNNSIKASGFSEMKNKAAGIGLAMSMKRNASLVDINFLNMTIPNKVVNNTTNQEISLSTFELVQMQYGYAIINTNSITMYPFAGIGLRNSQITLKNQQIINPSGINISNYVVTPQSVFSTSMKVSYQLGLGVDIKLGDNKNGDKTTFLFTKVGINNTIGDEKFKIDDFKYNPNVKLSMLQVLLGLKFAIRKTVDVNTDIIRD